MPRNPMDAISEVTIANYCAQTFNAMRNNSAQRAVDAIDRAEGRSAGHRQIRNGIHAGMYAVINSAGEQIHDVLGAPVFADTIAEADRFLADFESARRSRELLGRLHDGIRRNSHPITHEGIPIHTEPMGIAAGDTITDRHGGRHVAVEAPGTRHPSLLDSILHGTPMPDPQANWVRHADQSGLAAVRCAMIEHEERHGRLDDGDVFIHMGQPYRRHANSGIERLAPQEEAGVPFNDRFHFGTCPTCQRTVTSDDRHESCQRKREADAEHARQRLTSELSADDVDEAF